MQLEIGKPPTDQQLLATYQEARQRAEMRIVAGDVVGNALVLDPQQDTRFSLSNLGLFYGSTAHKFLAFAQNLLSRAEPNLNLQNTPLLHLTLGEVTYSDLGRKRGRDLITGNNSDRASVNGTVARHYHQSLQQNLNHSQNPIRLKLAGVIPTLDPISEYGQTAAVVAAFITEGDETIYRVRSDLMASIKTSGLELSSRLGAIKVLFSTLARFIGTPTEGANHQFPVLSAIGDINRQIPPDCYAEIESIDLIATATRYPDPSGHIFLAPAISLNQLYRSNAPVSFQRPWQKIQRLESGTHS